VDDNIGAGFVKFATVGSANVNIYFTPTCDLPLAGIAYLNGFILDLSSLALQFDAGSSHDLENISPVIITVGLSEAVADTVEVDYAVTGGTADGNGVDYTLLGNGTLTFDPCQTTQTILIEVVDDGLDEQDETIELTLSNVRGAFARLGEITQHTYTIISQGRPGRTKPAVS
jgi:hypothetical protein